MELINHIDFCRAYKGVFDSVFSALESSPDSFANKNWTKIPIEGGIVNLADAIFVEALKSSFFNDNFILTVVETYPAHGCN